MWCAQMMAHGETAYRYADAHVCVFERRGDPGCLVALNNDYFNPAWYTVTVQTSFGPNVRLHDHTGHNSSDCWTDSNGKATFGVPPGGPHGYGVWGLASLEGKKYVPLPTRQTVQDFDGASDLDIAPITSELSQIGRVWCESGTYISVQLKLASQANCYMMIQSPDGTVLADGKSDHVYDHTVSRGWHTFSAQLLGQPAGTSFPFTATVSYTAPKTLDVSEF
jgi:hypothetical protein